MEMSNTQSRWRADCCCSWMRARQAGCCQRLPSLRHPSLHPQQHATAPSPTNLIVVPLLCEEA